MAQLFYDGKPICRWCKEPLTKKDLTSANRPREVHAQHVSLRKNGLASGRWTRQMDDAVSQGEVELLQRRFTRRSGPLSEDALMLQELLADIHTLDGDVPQDLVQALITASAKLLKSVRSEPGEASAG